MQVLRNFSDFSKEAGDTDLAQKANPLYVGLESPMFRLENRKEREKKNREKELGEKGRKEIKIRRSEDALLLVVATRIYGKQVRALIDSDATGCFVTLASVKAVGLKGTP